MNYFRIIMIATGLAFSSIPVAILTIVTNNNQFFWLPVPICCIALGMMLFPLFQKEKPITSGEDRK